MPVYKCEVFDQLGNKKIVIKNANDEISLRAFIKQDNYVLLKATALKSKEPNVFFSVSSKVKRQEVVLFLRQFSVMITASIPISEALSALKSQKFTKAMIKVLMEVHHDVVSGRLLSEAFAAHPKVFPDFFVQMVAIGEVSGSLDTVLSSMADYYENDQKVKKKTKSAMVYPIFLLIMIVAVVIFLSKVILPRFSELFKEFDSEVPKMTQVILAMSDWINANFLYLLGGLVVLALVVFLFFKTKKGRLAIDLLKLKLPIIGNVCRASITSRFTSAFIILLQSGMNITDCLENLVNIMGNAVFASKLTYSIEEVKRGKRIAASIESTNIFPRMLTEMINVGEKSGNLEDVLKSTQSFFQTQVETAVAKATAALEPIIILILGGVVAIVLLAVYVPMISLMGSIT